MFRSVSTPRLLTADDLPRFSPVDRDVELVRGGSSCGTKIVWVVDPERREARVYRQDGSLAVLGNDDSLDGEDVLPGFTCRLSEILQP